MPDRGTGGGSQAQAGSNTGGVTPGTGGSGTGAAGAQSAGSPGAGDSGGSAGAEDATPGGAGQPANQSPEVQSVVPAADSVEVGSDLTVTCNAVDPEGDSLEYVWTAEAGSIGDGNPTVFTPDAQTGEVEIECLVRDAAGNESLGTATVQVVLPSTGLVAHWPFDGDLTDASGNGHHGAAVGGTAQYTSDRFGVDGNALLLNGARYVSVPHDSALSLTAFTFTAWVGPGAKSGSRRVIVSKPSASGFGNYTWYVMESDHASFPNRLGYVHDTSSGNWSAVCTGTDCILADGVMVHVAVVANASDPSLRYYVDGVLQSSAQPSAAVTNGLPFCIGSRCGSEGFAGNIDDVRVYGRELSELELQALAGG